jgi:hypothetical protein
MATLLSRLLPPDANHTYQGSAIALWLFGLVASIKTLQGLTSMLNTYTVATSADGIPLASYPPAASAVMVSLFALLGFLLALLGSLCILVLMRYRSLVPLMFLVLILHYIGAKIILTFHPIIRTGKATGVYINVALFTLMVVGLVLSLIPAHHAQQSE